MPTRTEIREIEEIQDSLPRNFASRLRFFRKNMKIKQTDFAKSLHIDIQKCRRYESVGTEPDVETLKKMASELKVTVDELIGYKPAAINIATDILNKVGITFENAETEDAYILSHTVIEEVEGKCYDEELGTYIPTTDYEEEKHSVRLTANELKVCVFETKRRTDAIIKAVLNETYAAFYSSVFWKYAMDTKYDTYSVAQLSKLPELFPERLRELRILAHISQAEMANEVGLSLQTYNRYETKNAQPSIDMLKRMALKLNVSVDVLVGFKPDFLNEALIFLEKAKITCTPVTGSKRYCVKVPCFGECEKQSSALHYCAYQAKEDTDGKIAADLKHIFIETFAPIFWELVDNHKNVDLGTIIDEKYYEPYLYEVDLMNKPEYPEIKKNESREP